MNLIKEINIKYFRSIYNIKFKNLNDCIIFSGKNDVGKSNILKAINLFFNNQTDWKTDFDFYNDFNLKRLKQVRESIKGKQFIQIEINFIRGKHFINTLPEEFSVKKTWDRNSTIPKESDNLERKLSLGKIKNKNIKIIKRSLTQDLNKIRFEYVPAIKDKLLFNHLLNQLQDEIFIQLSKKGEKIEDEISSISNKYSETIKSLKKEFANSTGISSELELPKETNDLFKVLTVMTNFDSSDKSKLNLDFRGDGIRLRFIPSLYNYLAENHQGNFILGFEEPENSMEYGLSAEMALKFANEYSKNSQIFITSHSPAFLNSTSKNVGYFRIFREDRVSKSIKINLNDGIFTIEKENSDNLKLLEELGLIEIQNEFHKKFEMRLNEAEKNKSEIKKLNRIIEQYTKPIVYTEGKTDVKILNEAWSKLYPEKEKDFEILPVETTSVDGGDGGYSALNRKIESVKETEKLQIGVYDRDEAGFKKGFNKLNKNLVKYNDKEFVKRHKNYKSFALVLPDQRGLEQFVKYCNLQIEFLFSKDDIDKRDENGRGLILNPYQHRCVFGGEVVTTIARKELYLCSIERSSKKLFAEKIVPTLNADSFKNFKLIFETIEEIVENNKTDK